MEREHAFSSRLLTRPVVRIQNTCCILWIKNYRLALYNTFLSGEYDSVCTGISVHFLSSPNGDKQVVLQMRALQ
jgi:hypothetical protein